jgi:hypothetical protein
MIVIRAWPGCEPFENYGALVPKIRALYEATFFAGLRKAGVPEE